MVLKMVLALIRNLSNNAIAEGVETEGQIAFLENEGFHIIQGFYYYKPMPAEGIKKLLKSNYKESQTDRRENIS